MDLLLGVALVLGVMILVHEWGHFIAARIFGVRVDVFSIGFGPRLFGWKSGPTDYRVSALPLGGYVRMAGQDPSEIDSAHSTAIPGKKKENAHPQGAAHGAPDELMSKPRWQRAIISFAGPLVNLIFPILLLTGVYFFKGEPYPPYLDMPVEVVAFPADASRASGLGIGDKVVSIGGIQNPTWEQAEKVVNTARPGAPISIEVENGGIRRTVNVSVPAKDSDLFGYAPILPVIDEVVSDSPAYRAGLQVGDQITAVNGQDIQWWGQFVSRVRGGNGTPVRLKVIRKGQVVDVNVTPQKMATPDGEPAYLIGVGTGEKFRRLPFKESVIFATQNTPKTVEKTVGIVG